MEKVLIELNKNITKPLLAIIYGRKNTKKDEEFQLEDLMASGRESLLWKSCSQDSNNLSRNIQNTL